MSLSFTTCHNRFAVPNNLVPPNRETTENEVVHTPISMFRNAASTAFRTASSRFAAVRPSSSTIMMAPARFTALRALSTEGSAVLNGTVKWFDSKKGFGFITPDDGSDDVFVHQTVIHAEGFRSLAEGEPVEFSLHEDPDGRIKAENVTGPMGAYVQGAPRRPRNDGFGDYEKY